MIEHFSNQEVRIIQGGEIPEKILAHKIHELVDACNSQSGDIAEAVEKELNNPDSPSYKAVSKVAAEEAHKAASATNLDVNAFGEIPEPIPGDKGEETYVFESSDPSVFKKFLGIAEDEELTAKEYADKTTNSGLYLAAGPDGQTKVAVSAIDADESNNIATLSMHGHLISEDNKSTVDGYIVADFENQTIKFVETEYPYDEMMAAEFGLPYYVIIDETHEDKDGLYYTTEQLRDLTENAITSNDVKSKLEDGYNVRFAFRSGTIGVQFPFYIGQGSQSDHLYLYMMETSSHSGDTPLPSMYMWEFDEHGTLSWYQTEPSGDLHLITGSLRSVDLGVKQPAKKGIVFTPKFIFDVEEDKWILPGTKIEGSDNPYDAYYKFENPDLSEWFPGVHDINELLNEKGEFKYQEVYLDDEANTIITKVDSGNGCIQITWKLEQDNWNHSQDANLDHQNWELYQYNINYYKGADGVYKCQSIETKVRSAALLMALGILDKQAYISEFAFDAYVAIKKAKASSSNPLLTVEDITTSGSEVNNYLVQLIANTVAELWETYKS